MKTCVLSLYLCLALFTSWSFADVVTIVDNTPGTANYADGTIGATEYVGYSSGINGGFGDVIGAGSRLYVDSSSAGALNFGLAKGGGSFNDAMVIYIDSVSGGFSSTTNFTDNGDPGRKAASGFGGGTDRSTLTFANGFQVDYAIAVESGAATVFQLVENGSHTYISSPSRAHTDASHWELSLSLANIGLVPGNSFKYVATYLNPGNAYRSNEFHGVASGFLSGGNPGNIAVTLPSYNVFVSAVPEISPALGIPVAVVLAAGTIGGWRRWKARSAN
jgi:hypothetical protein